MESQANDSSAGFLSTGSERPGFWLFAYGSLMWDPGFPHAERHRAVLRGYHRSFCVYSVRYRGTPEAPGLVLGLDRGGSCCGVAYRVADDDAAAVRAYLWEREMFTRVYCPREVGVRLVDSAHRRIDALTFVVDRAHAQYAGRLPIGELVRLIRRGEGSRGRCRDYLLNTVQHLEQMGLSSRQLRRLAAQLARGEGAAGD
ncbi:MAG: gamma-glutamylcyclotransferase [Alphaproteobacteria bacterium]